MDQQWTYLLLPIGMFVVMYFVSIRPESKKRKEQESMREALKVGDEITTIGGIIGKIVHIRNETVTFETGEDRVRLQVVKQAIARTGKGDTGDTQ